MSNESNFVRCCEFFALVSAACRSPREQAVWQRSYVTFSICVIVTTASKPTPVLHMQDINCWSWAIQLKRKKPFRSSQEKEWCIFSRHINHNWTWTEQFLKNRNAAACNETVNQVVCIFSFSSSSSLTWICVLKGLKPEAAVLCLFTVSSEVLNEQKGSCRHWIWSVTFTHVRCLGSLLLSHLTWLVRV